MKSCFLTLFVLCVATGTSAQTVRRVVMTPPAGSDDSGASWANATSLHNALFESVSGDMIWLKAGTYTPVNESRPRDAFFHVPAGVALYGGFAGTETSLSARNLSAAGTTSISGTYNVIQLITVAAGAQVTLDNLTIAGANSAFSETSRSGRTGAGVYAPAMADLLIRNCLFRNNSVKGSGGAVYGATGSNLTVIGSTFIGNSAVGSFPRFHAYGGAVYGVLSPSLVALSPETPLVLVLVQIVEELGMAERCTGILSPSPVAFSLEIESMILVANLDSGKAEQ